MPTKSCNRRRKADCKTPCHWTVGKGCSAKNAKSAPKKATSKKTANKGAKGTKKSATKHAQMSPDTYKTMLAAGHPGCVKQTTAKYVDRPSPPYPANECPEGTIAAGGRDPTTVWRVSAPNKNNVKRWVRVV